MNPNIQMILLSLGSNPINKNLEKIKEIISQNQDNFELPRSININKILSYLISESSSEEKKRYVSAELAAMENNREKEDFFYSLLLIIIKKLK